MHTVPRLIEQFLPSHYQLSLSLKRTERLFEGTVTIKGEAKTNGQITLHAKNLTVQSVTFDGKEAQFSTNDADELLISHGDITTAEHIFVIRFSGIITDQMHGLYPCYYTHNGEKKELLATQFESHHAREVFPCIDEPEAKATFDVSLSTEKDVTVLGNMPIKRQTVENDLLVTQFDITPRMSTYLLAWVMGDLQRKTALTTTGVEVNVWATPAQDDKSLDFALEHAVKTIEFFDTYFDTPYPLPKSDHVALPDFSSGAMENWGLITYREQALLAHPETTSITAKRYIAIVIAHELSHQWFGNLVTMKWWNNLWLNESFASLMEYIAVDALHPDWNIWLDFSTHEGIVALRRDALDGVQPVQTEVNHPDEIGTLFDGAIVYAKGARLLRMLQTYIRGDAFQRGLQTYFKKHAYSNTDENDLWNELSSASRIEIASFMNSWISQPGFPVVDAYLTNGELHLTQKQFFIGDHEVSDRLWPVPLSLPGETSKTIFSDVSKTVTYNSEFPLSLNSGDSAHFITNYSEELFEPILTTIETVPELERLQLLNVQSLLARAGLISSAQLINVLAAYKNETSEAVWDIMALVLSDLKRFVETNKEAESQLKALTYEIAKKQYERLGWEPKEDEPASDTKLRSTIISLVVFSDNTEALQAAINHYSSVELENLNPDLRAHFITAYIRSKPGSIEVEKLIQQYKDSTSVDIKLDIARGLTSARDQATLERLLLLLTDTSYIRPQDISYWFTALIRNQYSRAATWNWIETNWNWIEKTYDGDKSYDIFAKYSATALSTKVELERYRAFFMPLIDEPALTRAITLGIGEISARVELLERDSQAVFQALAKFNVR